MPVKKKSPKAKRPTKPKKAAKGKKVTKAKNPVGKPPYKPTKKDREYVFNMTGVGLTQDTIGIVMGMTAKTLRKHFITELATARQKMLADLQISMYERALTDTTMAIWLTKTAPELRWSERSPLDMTPGAPIAADGEVKIFIPHNGRD